MGPKIQHMWSQSLFILCNLLEANLLNIGEIDPLNRRFSMLPRPDTLVQGEWVGKVMSGVTTLVLTFLHVVLNTVEPRLSGPPLSGTSTIRHGNFL